MRWIVFALVLLSTASASQMHPARHYSFSGNDPAQWTSSLLSPREAAAPADFTAFPCNAGSCTVAQVITDASGNTYVVGRRFFLIQGMSGTAQLSDVYVAKLDPSGATLFLTTLSGKGSEEGRAIALDSAGNILLGGWTSSENFPLRNAIQTQPGVGNTGFLAKLSPDGSQLIYSTYFGGTVSASNVYAIASDSAGNAYATGFTGSRDFSATPGLPAGFLSGWGPGGVLGAFVVKLNATGEKILYSAIISGDSLACEGGSSCFLSIRTTSGSAIALDSAGNAYVAGNGNVRDLPTTAGVLAAQGIGGWVVRINASGTKLDYLTYLGTKTYGQGTYVSASTWASGLAVDAGGNAYVIGWTNDPKFPTTPGALQPVYNGPANPSPLGSGPPSDAFVAKLNPQGTSMVYATFLGGSGNDAATGIALDSAGAAYVTGTTDSSDFPLTAGASKGRDFIAALNPAGSALSFSSRYPGDSVSHALAIDAGGRVRAASLAGIVSSFALSPTPGILLLGVMSGTAHEPLAASVAPGEVVSLFGMQLGPADGVIAQAGSDGKLPTTLAGTQVLFDGVPAPLLYVSQDQVNAVSPFVFSAKSFTTVRVIAGTATSPLFLAAIIGSRPEIFGASSAAAVNQDGTINSLSNPAKLGSVVAIWATGIGSLFPPPVDGQIATAAQDYLCCKVYLSGTPTEVLYAGAAPGAVAGVVQINFRVPADFPISGVQQVPIGVALFSSMNQSANENTWIFLTP